MPSGLERVYNLAKNISAGEKSPFEKAAAIEKYLKNNYRYTLNPGKGEGENPVEDFLFYTKEGYCEQYATAMAMMLRTIGIPSRLGNYLIIRQRDAHSWVEAYMPAPDSFNRGWTTFDPTPPAEAVGAMPPATSVIAMYIDSLKWKWNRYIINYSFKDQMNVAKAVETNMRSLANQTLGFGVSSAERFEFFKAKALSYKWKDMLIFVTAAVIAAIILIITTRIVWKPKDRAKWPNAPLFYKNMLRLLAKKGKTKKAGETALEFAKNVNIEEVIIVTDIYYSVRFGGYRLTDNEKNKISACLTAIRKVKAQSFLI
ncbi:MAG: transglutaminase domain-containing protein [Deltaproteobacteria bacterium]|nr:transglutaminase domain-containing protein [Deltaproteobacteria bacterium]